jgi:3D (Asp-Asp-Asp) domain-containing protein
MEMSMTDVSWDGDDGAGEGAAQEDQSGAEWDGLPGVAVKGYPGLRAGVPGGQGLLQLARYQPPIPPPVYDPNARGCPGGYATRSMEVTGYTSGPESTGKRPGDPKYGEGAFGPVGPGSIAGDPKVGLDKYTEVYVPGYGLGSIRDKGRLIKGDTLDVWFPSVQQAKEWGRQKLNVEICNTTATTGKG